MPKGSSPSQALVARGGALVFGADLLAGVLQSFRIGADGGLEQRPPTPVDAAPPGPLGLATHPARRLLYAGLPAASRVGVFSYDDQGALQAVATVPNSGRATCWIAVNRAGSRLYTSNNGTNSVSVYDLSDPLSPAEIQHLPLRGGSASYQLSLDPAGRFLYVVSTNAASGRPEDNVIHALAVADDGKVTEEIPATVLPVPGNAHPAGLAVI